MNLNITSQMLEKILRAQIVSDNSFRDGDFGRHRDGSSGDPAEKKTRFVIRFSLGNLASRVRSVSASRRKP